MMIGETPIFLTIPNMATISQVQSALNKIVKFKIPHSVFLWGAPGIGKSAIVKKVAKDNNLQLIDLRVSQLAPTDLRGCPYIKDAVTYFAPPSFFPTEGEGILFIDEFNMASPSMMGIAQQLILDRQVGDYVVPEGWFIVAAGNRVEDKAAVSQMPSPVANRFIHLDVEADLESWKEHAIKEKTYNEQILSFLNYRPELLFKFNKDSKTWPSPRSWGMANSLLNIGLDISHAVGDGAASEFYAYQSIYTHLPDLDGIIAGKDIPAPTEPSLMYAVCGGLVSRCKSAKDIINSAKWVNKSTTEDYTALFMNDAQHVIQSLNAFGEFIRLMDKDAELKDFFARYKQIVAD